MGAKVVAWWKVLCTSIGVSSASFITFFSHCFICHWQRAWMSIISKYSRVATFKCFTWASVTNERECFVIPLCNILHGADFSFACGTFGNFTICCDENAQFWHCEPQDSCFWIELPCSFRKKGFQILWSQHTLNGQLWILHRLKEIGDVNIFSSRNSWWS